MANRSFAEEAACADQNPDDALTHLLQSFQGDWIPAEAYVQDKVAP